MSKSLQTTLRVGLALPVPALIDPEVTVVSAADASAAAARRVLAESPARRAVVGLGAPPLPASRKGWVHDQVTKTNILGTSLCHHCTRSTDLFASLAHKTFVSMHLVRISMHKQFARPVSGACKHVGRPRNDARALHACASTELSSVLKDAL